jgi:hypothetical protein
MSNEFLYVCRSLWLALLLCACGVSPSKPGTALSEAANGNAASNKLIQSLALTDIVFPQPTYPEELKKAWHRLVDDGKYRMARPDEFSEKAQRHIDSYGGIYLPLLFDINDDGGYDDFAVIVIDSTRSDDKRFGLVIFSAPRAEKQVFKPSWVFRERDLSKMALSRASARLVLTEYRDDGSQQSCSVRWHAQRGSFGCD